MDVFYRYNEEVLVIEGLSNKNLQDILNRFRVLSCTLAPLEKVKKRVEGIGYPYKIEKWEGEMLIGPSWGVIRRD